MAGWALGLFLLYLTLAFGLRTLVQLRRTGSSGFRGISGRPGSIEWFGGVLFVAALLLGLLAPTLQLAGVIDPVGTLDQPATHTIGLVLFGIGLLGTLGAQEAMGTSWRIGVEERERTELVTDGPFRTVRNPIFSAMVPAATGLALLAPNPLALAAVPILIGALEVQVRLVEEPHLLRTHGDRYAAYAARAGRFLPGVGRLREERFIPS
jgi:protein-S-isoprenylcysteine O-methyltransferase Ste14